MRSTSFRHPPKGVEETPAGEECIDPEELGVAMVSGRDGFGRTTSSFRRTSTPFDQCQAEAPPAAALVCRGDRRAHTKTRPWKLRHPPSWSFIGRALPAVSHPVSREVPLWAEDESSLNEERLPPRAPSAAVDRPRAAIGPVFVHRASNVWVRGRRDRYLSRFVHARALPHSATARTGASGPKCLVSLEWRARERETGVYRRLPAMRPMASAHGGLQGGA